MNLLTHQPWYPEPVAVGDIVRDVSCALCDPEWVRVVRLYPWGLRVHGGESSFDCTRWDREEESA